MRKYTVFLLFLFLVSCKKEQSSTNPDPKNQEIRNCKPASINKKKVLFIGIDGCRTDALLNANAPAMDSLISTGLFISQVDRGPNTVSVPGWSTLLHGVFPAKHCLIDNTFDQQDNFTQYPDMFTRIREAHSGYNLFTITHWYNFLRLSVEEDFAIAVDSDKELKDSAIWLLNNCNPDMLMLHFDEADDAGHSVGFSTLQPEYMSAIEQTDGYINEVIQTIRQRENDLAEKWMVVICTDHGGSGTSHGGQDFLPQTRFVWLILNGEGIPNQNQIGNAANTDVFPSVMKFLEIPVQESWGLDGKALY